MRALRSPAKRDEAWAENINNSFTYYTYILRSTSHPEKTYVGFSADLKTRFSEHNARKAPHTSRFTPWKLETYIAFDTEVKAKAFEQYLKTASGIAFRRKRL